MLVGQGSLALTTAPISVASMRGPSLQSRSASPQDDRSAAAVTTDSGASTSCQLSTVQQVDCRLRDASGQPIGVVVLTFSVSWFVDDQPSEEDSDVTSVRMQDNDIPPSKLSSAAPTPALSIGTVLTPNQKAVVPKALQTSIIGGSSIIMGGGVSSATVAASADKAEEGGGGGGGGGGGDIEGEGGGVESVGGSLGLAVLSHSNSTPTKHNTVSGSLPKLPSTVFPGTLESPLAEGDDSMDSESHCSVAGLLFGSISPPSNTSDPRAAQVLRRHSSGELFVTNSPALVDRLDTPGALPMKANSAWSHALASLQRSNEVLGISPTRSLTRSGSKYALFRISRDACISKARPLY
jgi:hypothetical protein